VNTVKAVKPLLFLLPVLLCGLALFIFSSQSYHRQSIVPILKEIIPKQQLADVLPHVSVTYGNKTISAQKHPYHFIEFFFRKSAHLFMYAMAGAFLYFALIPYRIRFAWKAVAVVLGVAVLAYLDEWNQSLRAFRNGNLEDIILDTVGGFIGLLVCAGLWRVFRRKQNQPNSDTLSID
jgi:VanZ family protein